jgi:hypothetical protein
VASILPDPQQLTTLQTIQQQLDRRHGNNCNSNAEDNRRFKYRAGRNYRNIKVFNFALHPRLLYD